MRARLELRTESGLVVLSDSRLPLAPPAPSSPAFRRYFRELADQAKLFFLDGEDRSQFRLLVCADDNPGDLPAHRFRRLSGSFLLPLPSGRLSVSDQARRADDRVLEVEPGNYSVSVLGVGQGELDGTAFRAEQIRLLGEADYRFRQRVDRSGLVAFLPFLAAFPIILAYKLSLVSLVAGAIGVGSLLPHHLIRQARRYRETERRLHEYEASLPHFVLDLRRVERPAGLIGGHFVV